MPTSMQCIILLTCMGICSSTTIRTCRCLKPVRSVRFDLVTEVRSIPVRPYCSKEEVIVQLKNNGLLCLEPKFQWTRVFLQRWEKMKNNPSPNKTTATTTTLTATLATTAQTS
ncbi:hypothetical protein Q5P01_002521 [Channa striata]|uniref:Chemokine interleukin-8-like domain-containing protein n=1 Tax=Channa striata TaxID=64152 RepID=A0AA88P0S3_CHASR|nr:hypothetical protein Q5P01_002521 [Channa striata]